MLINRVGDFALLVRVHKSISHFGLVKKPDVNLFTYMNY
jgi:hypothetical protein